MSTKKANCFIVNGIIARDHEAVPANDKKKWVDWVQEQLTPKGIETTILDMPAPWQPVYKDWKNVFDKLPVHENTILIGRSAGGAFLVRWLGENTHHIKKLILVAPGKNTSSNSEYTRDLYDFEVQPVIKERVGEIIIFTSPEEPEYRQENVRLYQKLLDARVISLPGKGHYVSKDMISEKLPELLEEILR